VALYELFDASFLRGHFSRELEPVVTVDPGNSIRISVPNAGWAVSRDEHVARPDPELDTGHALAGPVAVRGARAGQTLVVRIEDVIPGAWGVTFTAPPHRIDWELTEGVGRGAGREVLLAPFLGVLGMPPVSYKHHPAH
jgi:acetamidase/formamidase